MAWFPSNVTFPSILGELYSAAFTAPAFNWLCSPAVTELETIVLDWLAHVLHLPDCFLSKGEGGGVIQGTASEAIVTVMVAARERYLNQACAGLEGREREEKLNYTRGRMVALGSEESHSSTAKAALIAGVRHKAIPTRIENHLALTGEDVRNALDECMGEGLEPFYLTTTLGTTATCATDRFSEIAEILRKARLSKKVWTHVDAAYAGAALVLDDYVHIADQFVSVDSFDMNMHKWLLTNFDASCLYVRTRAHLIKALSISRSYLSNTYSDSGLVTDYRDWQIPLGRRFRALKIWFVLRSYGVNGLKAHIRRHIVMGEKFASWIKERDDLWEIVTPPAFALTVITLASPGPTKGVLTNGTTDPKINEGLECPDVLPSTGEKHRSRTNALTKTIYERINSAGEIFLTSGIVKGIYAIRIVLGNEKGNETHLRRAFEILVETAETVISESKPEGKQPLGKRATLKRVREEGEAKTMATPNGKRYRADLSSSQASPSLPQVEAGVAKTNGVTN